MTKIISEDQILQCIDEFFPKLGSNIILARGDDAAVLNLTAPLVISTDIFSEHVHFRRSYFSPQDIGYKSLAVNLSDLAACGASPVGCTIGLSLPPGSNLELVQGICQGLAELADAWRVPILGGDISQGNLSLCLTILGQVVKPLCRKMAQVGDSIFLLGKPGLARVGFSALESLGLAEAVKLYPQSVAAHLRPQPLITAGLRLQALNAQAAPLTGRDHSLGLMDLSDGLARDLPRLLPQGLGAELNLIPHPEVVAFAKANNQDPVELAFLGGEDYGLLGTCAPSLAPQVMVTLAEASILGQVKPGKILCGTQEFGRGFDHFQGV